MTLRFPRIRDIALDTKVYDDGHKVQAVASWNGLRSVWCRISETDDPLPSGEVAQCQRLAIRMLRILAWTRCAPAARMVDQAKKRAARHTTRTSFVSISRRGGPGQSFFVRQCEILHIAS